MHHRSSSSTLYAGELEIRLGEGLVLATGRALTLSVREFELLVAMAGRARRDRHARGALQRRVGRRAARRRPLGRRLREQAAQQARGGDARPPLHPHPPGLRLPLPTAAFTRCSHRDGSCHEMLHERGTPSIEETALETGPAHGGLLACSPSAKPARGDVVIKNKMGALAAARCSRRSRRVRKLEHSSIDRQPASSSSSGDDLRRGLDVRRPRLRTVGLGASRV